MVQPLTRTRHGNSRSARTSSLEVSRCRPSDGIRGAARALLLGAPFLCFGVSSPAWGQGGASKPSAVATGSARSYANARQVLEAGIHALGGVDRLRSPDDVTVTETGHDFQRNQSVRVDPPWDRTPADETLFVDVKQQRYRSEYRDPERSSKEVVSGGQGFFVDPGDKMIFPFDPADLPARTFEYVSHLPHLLLLHALEQRAATLRYLGDEMFERRKHRVVTFATADGRQVTLFFDARTNLLSKLEQMVSDAQDGDTVQETIYSGYRPVSGIQVPSGRLVRRGGDTLEDRKYTGVRFNTRPSATTFTRPKGYREDPPEAAPPNRETRLARGVYLFEDGVNSLVIELEDHVIVVEPHMGSRGAKATIAKAREMFPGKPVRFVVITHHHFDHAGGVRSYVAEGIKVVTTPANRGFLERMAAATFTIKADDQTKARRKPVFELVDGGKRVFADPKQTIELIDIGPSPHAHEMLVVYLPRHKLVFQGDLLRLGPDRKIAPSMIDETALHFHHAMKRLGLQVERIAGVHGPVASMKEFRQAVERKRGRRGRR